MFNNVGTFNLKSFIVGNNPFLEYSHISKIVKHSYVGIAQSVVTLD